MSKISLGLTQSLVELDVPDSTACSGNSGYGYLAVNYIERCVYIFSLEIGPGSQFTAGKIAIDEDVVSRLSLRCTGYAGKDENPVQRKNIKAARCTFCFITRCVSD